MTARLPAFTKLESKSIGSFLLLKQKNKPVVLGQKKNGLDQSQSPKRPSSSFLL